MTETDRMLLWLRKTMAAAERDAEAAGGDEWRRQAHPSDTVAIYDSEDEPVVYDEGSPSEEQQAHIICNSPAAVLRRIAADRKLLELHQPVPGWPDECTTCLSDRGSWPETWSGDTCPCRTIRLLAESWGWSGEVS
ncbi:hypothetical protein GCM10010331_49270 [Streptomyces xanthochromogenes]|uniref:DUF6221 family protein n=1 Tax=Streptomyces xanthochromogenes TaxID=67384 RepID=UPI0016762219|nr:DUF6221 family protein [Streptomyces xanthochromogenes]GHB55586.1 hypothetical protein GCM10010331_49270 [Streptomyces xanthochromogenes]